MTLSCVYTDLDGTLLGLGSSIFRDSEGGFSMAQANSLEPKSFTKALAEARGRNEESG